MVEGDFVNMTCYAETAGRWKPKHNIRTGFGDTLTQYDCSGGHGGEFLYSCGSVNEEITQLNSDREYYCETFFELDPNEIEEGHATNTPDYYDAFNYTQFEEVQCKSLNNKNALCSCY